MLAKWMLYIIQGSPYWTDMNMYASLRTSGAIKDGILWRIEPVFNQFPKHHMKILLDSSANVWKDNIQNASTHGTGNYNGIRKINFANSENMTAKKATFPPTMKIIFWLLQMRKTQSDWLYHDRSWTELFNNWCLILLQSWL